jgi:8-oxo-dGTP pyrophosphatase MutT (NUDIX family)
MRPATHLRQRHGAGILFINPAATHVLLQRKDATYRDFPDCLAILGGRIQHDEDSRDAALREIHEEFDGKLPLRPQELQYWKTVADARPAVGILHLHHIFWCRVPEATVELAINEGQGIEWVAFTAILAGDAAFVWNHRATVLGFYQFLQGEGG